MGEIAEFSIGQTPGGNDVTMRFCRIPAGEFLMGSRDRLL